MLALGAILIVGGLVAIILGWLGAANTGLAFEQTPYLISGGLLGVALVFLGGFVYFAFWITRLVRESRAQSDRASELLDRIAETLDGANLNGQNPRGRTRSASSSVRAPSARTATFVATRSGTQFHKPDCPVVAGRSGLRRVSANARGMTPCRICDPLGA
jgi:membrane-bound ClpP family serine protease